METHWKRLVGFVEKQPQQDIGLHQPCLQELHSGLKRAVSTILTPPKAGSAGTQAGSINPEEVKDVLVIVKKTVLGQNCPFGAHVFSAKQVGLILLRLLRLLPEPAFEPVSAELVDLAALLVEQLYWRDMTMLASFVGDASCVLRDVREKPNRLSVFPHFTQQYMDRHGEVPSSSSSSRAAATLSVELSSGLRLSVFCRRFVEWMALIAKDIHLYAVAADVEALGDAMLRLVPTLGSLQQSTEAATAVIAFFRSSGLAAGSGGIVSLTMQLRVLEDLPTLAGLLCTEESPALIEFVLEVIEGCDMTVLVPQLRHLLQPFLTSGRDGVCQIIHAVACRCQSIGYTLEELWLMLFPIPADATGAVDVIKAAKDPALFEQLAGGIEKLGPAGISSLAGHAAACLAARQGFKSPQSTPADASLMLLLSVYNRCASQQGTGGNTPFPQLLVEETKGMLKCQSAGALEATVTELALAVESLRSTPALVAGLECDGQDCAMRLANLITTEQPEGSTWQAFLSTWKLFVAEATVPLSVKCTLLRQLISTGGSQERKRPAVVELAGWSLLAEALVRSIAVYAAKAVPQEGHACVLDACSRTLSNVQSSLAAGGLNLCTLQALAYVVPLLVTLDALADGASQQEQNVAVPPLPTSSRLTSLPAAIHSEPNVVKVEKRFRTRAPDTIGSTGCQDPPLYMGGLCPFCGATSSSYRGSNSAPSASQLLPLPSISCHQCQMSCPLVMRWQMFEGANTSLTRFGAWCAAVERRRCAVKDMSDMVKLLAALQAACLAALQDEQNKAGKDTDNALGRDVVWLLVNGWHAICIAGQGPALRSREDGDVGNALQAGLQLPSVLPNLNPLLYRMPLLFLVKSDSFAAMMLQAQAESGKGGLAQWRMSVVSKSVSHIGAGNAEIIATGNMAGLSGADIWAVCAPSDSLEKAAQDMLIPLASRVAQCAVKDGLLHQEAPASLRALLHFCMLSQTGSVDLFEGVQGTSFLRIFDTYSEKRPGIVSLCQLLLKGPLLPRVRSLLPRWMPHLVLSRNMETIAALSSLLEESVQSVVGPQLPFILSVLARQGMEALQTTSRFLLEKVYNKQMTMSDICHAAMGKTIVLILWGSIAAVEHLDSQRALSQASQPEARAISALSNIAAAVSQGLEASSLESRRKRKAAEVKSIGGMLSGAASPMKRRATAATLTGTNAAATSQQQIPSDVAEILESNFLHLLDIFEQLLRDDETQDWAMQIDVPSLHRFLVKPGSHGICRKHLLEVVKLFLELTSQNLHIFAPKVFEFLQSMSAYCASEAYRISSVECWRVYVVAVGVQRLWTLVPAVVHELLSLSKKMNVQGAGLGSNAVDVLLGHTIQAACNIDAKIALVLPSLPPQPELQQALALVEAARQKYAPLGRASYFDVSLESALKQLTGATQYAIKSAALQTITTLVVAQANKQDMGSILAPQQRADLLKAVFNFLWDSRQHPADQQLCGQLLGAIGAYDPGSVLFLEQHGATGHSKVDATTSNILPLARSLLDFLAPHLGSSNAHAYAVQEILKHLQSMRLLDNLFQDLLTEDLRQALSPYKTTAYKMVDGTLLNADLSTFEGVLASAIMMLDHGQHRPLFEACMPTVQPGGKHAFALFLMQHVVYQLLKSNTSLHALEKLSTSLRGLLKAASRSTAQAVFAIYDDLAQRAEDMDLASPLVDPSTADAKDTEKRKKRLEGVLSQLPPRVVATASARHGSYARALRCLEEAIIDDKTHRRDKSVPSIPYPYDEPKLGEEDCLQLQDVYRALEEPHGMLGALRVGPATTKTRSLLLEQSRQWHDVVSFYEEQLRNLPTKETLETAEDRRSLLGALVRSTRHTQKFETLSGLVSSLGQDADMQARIKPYAIEAAWQLSKWDALSDALALPATQPDRSSMVTAGEDFQEPLGRAIAAVHCSDGNKLQDVIKEARLDATQALASVARESYARAYPQLLRLHMLADLECLQKARDGPSPAGQMADRLLKRAEVISPSSLTTVLCPLRVLLSDMGWREDAKRIDLALVKHCRKHDLLVCMEHPSSGFKDLSKELQAKAQLEWGRLLYTRGPRHDALKHTQDLGKSSPKALLAYTRWATEPSSELLIPRVAEAEFKKVQEKLPDWEAGWFYHAVYLDGILKEQMGKLATEATGSPSEGQTSAPRNAAKCPFSLPNLVRFTIRGYLQALLCGTKRLHFILNRVLQLTWDCCETSEQLRTSVLAVMEKEVVAPQPWMWYVVLPQLLSRVHNPHTRQLFSDIISKVVRAYPRQAGWHMMQLVHSINGEHKKTGANIMYNATKNQSDVHRYIFMITNLAHSLHMLAYYTPEDANATSIRLNGHRVPELARLVSCPTKSKEAWTVLVPLQRQLTADIPALKGRQAVATPVQVFVGDGAGITSSRCLEEVTVFRSKDRPKRITFIGDDGRTYPFLCKQEKKSDLRKDARLMEFGAMLNQMLAKNADARRCGLEARTFAVLPFAESCAIIEWVHGTRTFRHIVDDLWRRTRPNQLQGPREVKEIYDVSKNIYEAFTKQVLPRHPPVLQRWFHWRADPSTWLSRRLVFVRSQALWCMLGYVVGLGDRHGENILLDETSGRVVHVDFECLFGKGMLLAQPETVPFRLTQNCVAAMGVTGVEGIFRECCELSLGIMRDKSNKQTLLSVLHAFVADPLIDWQQAKNSEAGRQKPSVSDVLQVAKHTIGEVERKLDGMLNVGAHLRHKLEDSESVLMPEDGGKKNSLLGKDRGVGLSVSGQVDELLKASMCKRNLSEMYVGWQPWM